MIQTMVYTGVVFVFVVLSLAVGDEICPSASQILPCTCDAEGINCMDATTLAEIRKAFRAKFPFEGIPAVWIQATPITDVPADLFGTIKMLTVYVERNEVKSVDMKAFANSKQQLRLLSFFGNKIDDISNFTRSLQDFPRMSILNLGGNYLQSIPASAFRHNSLTRLILNQNQITLIGQNAFAGLTNLQKLELASNKLTTLGPYSISLSSTYPGLEVLLHYNSISSVSNTAFSGANPQIVNMQVNQLTTLGQAAFQNLVDKIHQNGGQLDVSHNPLSCKGCDYRWIMENRSNYRAVIVGFRCPDGTGIDSLTSFKIGC